MFSIFKSKIKVFLLKIMFAATSLAPVIFAFGVSEWERDNWSKDSVVTFMIYLVISILLIPVCCFMLSRFEKKTSRSIPMKKIERADNNILSFLLIFLLPFIRSDNSSIINNPVTTFICVGIILIVISDIGAYHFNPTLRILKYHIYFVETTNATGILIAKTDDILYGNDIDLNVVILSDDYRIYLHTKK